MRKIAKTPLSSSSQNARCGYISPEVQSIQLYSEGSLMENLSKDDRSGEDDFWDN